jgi:3-phosphoshikimate 1-carboxyvinyltransferase
MALPDLIEIVPLDKPVKAEITVPGSKSITNRALILAALADGEVTLTGALWSEDTQIMVECLQKLGFAVNVATDPDEFCNRTIKVKDLGGKIPNAGTTEKPLELFVGNAGTAARFLSAFVCLGKGVYRLSGVPRMHERPQAALFQALRELGYRVESENGNDKLPVKIFGEGPMRGKCTVSIEESSQFASALLLCAKIGKWEIEVVGENAEESPYVVMTSELVILLNNRHKFFHIEPDASSGSYFQAASWLLWASQLNPDRLQIRVQRWPSSNMQIDAKYPAYQIESRHVFSRKSDLADGIMTQIVLAPFSRLPLSNNFRFPRSDVKNSLDESQPIIFTDLGRLRVQETERVVALRTELTKCGAKVVEEGDTLTVWPSPLHGAEIETYKDHRMAMCFAVLGLKVPGIKIKDPACVKKTFPNFFQKLAAAPPAGLGVTIIDPNTGRRLNESELFAD